MLGPRRGGGGALAESMRTLGQLTAVVACRHDDAVVLVDGFKRLVAARHLELPTLRTRVLPLSEQAAVAAIYSLNRHGRGLLDLEEAFIVRTLVREQGLAQAEVAVLLGRHASWVCRRLALLERLDAGVRDDVRAGLISTTVAREVARLPRGNQADVAAAVSSAALTTREATVLVGLVEKSRSEHERRALLEAPRPAVERALGGPTPPPWDARLSPPGNALRRGVLAALSGQRRALGELGQTEPARWSDGERAVLVPLLQQLRVGAAALCERLTLVLPESADGTDHR